MSGRPMGVDGLISHVDTGKCKICSKHFITDCFTDYLKVEMKSAISLKLSDTAVPSI